MHHLIRLDITALCLLLASQSFGGLPLETKGLRDLETPQVLLLKDLLDGSTSKYFGIEFSSDEDRAEILNDAEKYLRYRKTQNPKAKLEFLASCEENLNGFCEHETERLEKKEIKSLARVRFSPKQIQKWIFAADLLKLEEIPYNDLLSSMKKISNPAKLDLVVQKIKADDKCVNSAILNSVAAKLEEYFPEQIYIDDAKALYAKSVGCGSGDSASLKAAYRLSILNIWQNQFEMAQSLLANVETGLSDYQSRAKYWRGYCSGKSPVAPGTVAQDFDLKNESLINFQNILVHGDQVQAQISNDQDLKVMNRSVISPEANSKIEAIEALLTLRENARAAEFTESLLPQIQSSEPEVRLYLAFLMHSSKNSIAEFHALSQLFIDTPRMITENTLKMYFPLEFYQAAQDISKEIDPFIILSIIRQESAFNPHAQSKAGARGLMQVMVPTARKIASLSSRKLFDPSTNIKVGVKLFANQVKRFGGDIELALAAYNAGRLKVEDWQKRYPSADKMLFLDLIPYRETREYVTMILRNYYWYQRLYPRVANSAYKIPSLIQRIMDTNEKAKLPAAPAALLPKETVSN